MRVDLSGVIVKSGFILNRRGRLLRPASALGLLLAMLFGLAAAGPASAQLRGAEFTNRGFSVGPRMMSPGSFGTRLDPTFRTSPGGGDSTTWDSGGDNSGGGSSTTRKVHNTQHNNSGGSSGSSQTARRNGTGVPPAGERRYVPDEVVVEIGGAPTDQQIQALATQFRLVRLESLRIALTNTTFLRWRIPDRRPVPAVVRSLERDARVRTAQPNYLYVTAESAAAPPPPSEGDPAQYALAKLRLGEAHGLARGDKVKVAVIDSGIDVEHPELAGVIAGQYDALDSKEGPHPHGTGIAGIIAAHARLMGAAPAVQILAVRAFGATQGSTFSILKGLDWAVTQNARVINMSFAGPSDPALQRALAAARQKGAILVAAAGNAGPKSPPLYPAADAGVIAVTATDANDKLFAMANRGRYVAIAAPGVDILMPAPNGAYQMSSGTSMAAAYVSGIAALILERQPKLDPDAIRKVLLSTARDLGPKGRDDQFGAGLTDAYQAVMSLETKAADTAGAGPAKR